MQRSAAFGDIELLTIEQASECGTEVAGLGQCQQRGERLPVLGLAREIEIQRALAQRKINGPARIAGNQRGKLRTLQARGAGFQHLEPGHSAHAACVGME